MTKVEAGHSKAGHRSRAGMIGIETGRNTIEGTTGVGQDGSREYLSSLILIGTMRMSIREA
jgi:hypothetical protein